jgi:hypothetical protein
MLRLVVSEKLTDVSEVLIALMMETVSTSGALVNFCQTTLRNIAQGSQLYIRRRENLKSHCTEVNYVSILARKHFIVEG